MRTPAVEIANYLKDHKPIRKEFTEKFPRVQSNVLSVLTALGYILPNPPKPKAHKEKTLSEQTRQNFSALKEHIRDYGMLPSASEFAKFANISNQRAGIILAKAREYKIFKVSI